MKDTPINRVLEAMQTNALRREESMVSPCWTRVSYYSERAPLSKDAQKVLDNDPWTRGRKRAAQPREHR